MTMLAARSRARTVAIVLILLLLCGAAIWSRVTPAPARQQPARVPTLQLRSFGDVGVSVPAGWTMLQRTDTHVTWGAADRSHTVTLATTESSVLPLSGIVQEVVRAAPVDVPGMRSTSRPRTIELPDPRSGDAAMLARFQLELDARTVLHVRQVWRRSEATGRDIVATWTSSDGSWPVTASHAVPQVLASR